jgi:hypothetical protein
MPVCEAMPASFAFMDSNSGPSVSVRRYSSSRRKRAAVSGFTTSTVARGLASTFSRVLLKNWNVSATWPAST